MMIREILDEMPKRLYKERTVLELPDGRVLALALGDGLSLRGSLLRADAVVSDPPYGQGFRMGAAGPSKMGSRTLPGRKASKPIHGDNVPFSPGAWTGFPRVALCGAHVFYPRLPEGHLWGWDKDPGGKAGCMFCDGEFIWSNVRTPRNVWRQRWKGLLRDKTCEDALSRKAKRHVSQKPIGVMRWAMANLKLAPGMVVLDPYAGSGSTGVAALAHGVNFLGVEIDRENYEGAVTRLRAAVAEWEDEGSAFRRENEAFRVKVANSWSEKKGGL